MNSVWDTPKGVGFPIRKSADHGLLAAPHSLSQRATSFIASQCQGIHQMPLRRLISLDPTDVRPCAGANLHNWNAQPLEDACPGDVWAVRTHLSSKDTSSVTFSHTLHLSMIPRDRGCPRKRSGVSRQGGVGPRRNPCCGVFPADGLLLPQWRSPGGGGRDRTDGLMLAKHALSQLSYAPARECLLELSFRGCPLTREAGTWDMVGQGGFEPPTSRLSSARSNQLSY